MNCQHLDLGSNASTHAPAKHSTYIIFLTHRGYHVCPYTIFVRRISLPLKQVVFMYIKIKHVNHHI
jgi:hypothetical protein